MGKGFSVAIDYPRQNHSECCPTQERREAKGVQSVSFCDRLQSAFRRNAPLISNQSTR